MKRFIALSAAIMLAACTTQQAPPEDTATAPPTVEQVPQINDTAAYDSVAPRGINRAQNYIVLPIRLLTAVSQSDVVTFSFTPGFAFRVVSVGTYCLVEAGTVTADVKIGTTSVLNSAVAFTSATKVAGSVKTAAASRGGGPTSVINVHYTSDGTGALTNGFVIIVIEPT